MQNFSVHCPINPVSFGVVSIAILRELFDSGQCPPIFTIGDVNLESQASGSVTEDFANWLKTNIGRALRAHKRDWPVIKLWHIAGSLESFSKDQSLITFHETDSLTKEEINILSQQKHVYVTSTFTRDIFKSNGVENVSYLDLGFDKHNFWKIEQNRPYTDGRTVWGLAGKLEPVRKQHAKTLKAWVKKYGNNKDHFLHAFVYNSFLKPEDNNALIGQILEGKQYSNIKFFPASPNNEQYNAILNSVDIMLGMSGGEGRDLPVFHAAGIGKHILALNAHAYKDYLNEQNAVLIDPTGKIKAEDGIFFKAGQPFNQGHFFDWDIDDFCDKCDIVLDRFKKNNENIAGLELQKKTYKNTVAAILADS